MRILWLLIGLISLSAAVVSIYALVLSRQVENAVSGEQAIYGPLAIMAWAGVGGLILARYPRHVIGWLLLVLSGVLLQSHSSSILQPALVQIGRLNPDDFIVRLFDWIGLWAWVLFLVMPSIFLPLYFPTGTLPSRRWRIVSAAAVVSMIGIMLSLAVEPGGEEFGMNPFVIPGGEAIAGILLVFAAPTLFLAMLGSLASMAVRYRRAEAIERQQMKWLFYPLGVFLIWLIYDLVIPEISPQLAEQTGSDIVFVLIVFAIPVAIGIAILRYRLYDIDLIIRRTLVYGVVTAALAVVYFGSVVLLQQLTAGVSGQRSPVIIVISTLLIAALFSPLRRRVQEFIDRRFYRSKYDKAQTLAGFAQVARDETDLDALTAELVAVVRATMMPETVQVWLRPPERRERPSRRRPGG